MMSILVIDIGGNNVKIRLKGQEEVRKTPSGPEMTPRKMVEDVKQMAVDWAFDRVSIGYPGPVGHGRILLEPVNLGRGWVDFDFATALGCPVKLINDAAMQALGSYEGGRMLFLGLGTGLGSTLILDHVIAAMELGHLPYKKGKTFEDYVGTRGLEERGKRKWRRAVVDVVARLQHALIADYVVLGGGNVKKLDELPPGVRLGSNVNAFVGGERLWEEHTRPAPPLGAGPGTTPSGTPGASDNLTVEQPSAEPDPGSEIDEEPSADNGANKARQRRKTR
jgi:polyphosphate glucokinase